MFVIMFELTFTVNTGHEPYGKLGRIKKQMFIFAEKWIGGVKAN